MWRSTPAEWDVMCEGFVERQKDAMQGAALVASFIARAHGSSISPRDILEPKQEVDVPMSVVLQRAREAALRAAQEEFEEWDASLPSRRQR